MLDCLTMAAMSGGLLAGFAGALYFLYRPLAGDAVAWLRGRRAEKKPALAVAASPPRTAS